MRDGHVPRSTPTAGPAGANPNACFAGEAACIGLSDTAGAPGRHAATVKPEREVRGEFRRVPRSGPRRPRRTMESGR